MWIWLAVVLVFFSIPQSKLIGYVLPALPPLALFVALTVRPMLDNSPTARRLWRASAGAAVCVCLVVVITFTLLHPKSSRELATQLASHRVPHEGLAFIDEYPYDVEFYLHDSAPVIVVSNWDPVEIRQNDNWRKELADAGSYAPNLAARRLAGDAQFRSALCDGGIKWVIASRDHAQRYPFLAAAPVIATERDRALWHTDTSDARFKAAIGCNAAPVRLAQAK
jgi:hypothetical protein